MMNNLYTVLKKNGQPLTYKDLITEERVNQLKQTLKKYKNIVKGYSEGGDKENPIYPSHLILDTYTFEKPLTSIEECDLKNIDVLHFFQDMKNFFFVTYKSSTSEINVSRFRTLSKLPLIGLEGSYTEIRFSEAFADFVGNSYGKTPKQLANYCLKEKLYDLIK